MAPRFPFLELATVNRPFMNELQQRVAAVVASGRYVGGPEVEEFEQRLCDLTGARYAIGVSNGLDALRLILRAWVQLGILRAGDEVIVPANTYIASVLAITDAGLTPVLAEPDPRTSNLDLSRLEEYLTPRTRAVMPVHLYGRVCWSASLEEFARRNSLKIIEDNAQAIGASILTSAGNEDFFLHGDSPRNSRRVHTGNLGDAAAFSFYPTKNIGALGDAGAVTTSDAALAATVRALANYGADRRYHNIMTGFNCRLDPVQAAVLNVKLPHVDRENDYRRHLAEIYCSEIHNPAVRLPLLPDNPGEMVWHQFVVHVDDRDRFTAYLDANSIGWDLHYATPPHLQPCYSDKTNIISGELPVTEQLAATLVSLPITRCTSPEDARTISEIISRY